MEIDWYGTGSLFLFIFNWQQLVASTKTGKPISEALFSILHIRYKQIFWFYKNLLVFRYEIKCINVLLIERNWIITNSRYINCKAEKTITKEKFKTFSMWSCFLKSKSNCHMHPYVHIMRQTHTFNYINTYTYI